MVPLPLFHSFDAERWELLCSCIHCPKTFRALLLPGFSFLLHRPPPILAAMIQLHTAWEPPTHHQGVTARLQSRLQVQGELPGCRHALHRAQHPHRAGPAGGCCWSRHSLPLPVPQEVSQPPISSFLHRCLLSRMERCHSQRLRCLRRGAGAWFHC